jgi:ElaB/YqjD/DUF883 family membrane-anchored ribosome-binding protein
MNSPNEGTAMNDMSNVGKDKLIADMKVVVSDAEELLRVTANSAGDKVGELRNRIQDRLVAARANLAEAQAVMVDRARQAGRVADDYVHDNPWRSVGIAAGVGLIIGLLIGRR